MSKMFKTYLLIWSQEKSCVNHNLESAQCYDYGGPKIENLRYVHLVLRLPVFCYTSLETSNI